jgi:hypothetical protein
LVERCFAHLRHILWCRVCVILESLYADVGGIKEIRMIFLFSLAALIVGVIAVSRNSALKIRVSQLERLLAAKGVVSAVGA